MKYVMPALLLTLISTEVSAQFSSQRYPGYPGYGPGYRGYRAPMPRVLPQPQMRYNYIRPPGHISSGRRIPGQTAGQTPYRCDRFGRCWIY